MLKQNLSQDNTFLVHKAALTSLLSVAIFDLKINDSFPSQTISILMSFSLPILFFLLCIPFLNFNFKKTPSIVILALFFLLFLWSTVTSIWSDYPDLSFRRALIVYLPGFILLLLLFADKRHNLTFWKVLKWLLFLGILLSATGIFLYVFGERYANSNGRFQSFSLLFFNISQEIYGLSYQNRISSLTGNPNSLAMWLMMTIIFTMALNKAKKIRTFYFLVALSIQTIALVMTSSRSGIGATAIALSLFYLFSSPRFTRKIKTSLILIFSFSIFVAILFMSDNIKTLFVRGSDTLLTGRELLWRLGIDSFNNHPILGVGFNTSHETILEPLGITFTLHNTHLTMLVEAGIIGFILFTSLWIFSIFCSLYNTIKTTGETRILYSVAFSLLVGLYAHQFFETIIPRAGFFTMMWIYFMCIATTPPSKLTPAE